MSPYEALPSHACVDTCVLLTERVRNRSLQVLFAVLVCAFFNLARNMPERFKVDAFNIERRKFGPTEFINATVATQLRGIPSTGFENQQSIYLFFF